MEKASTPDPLPSRVNEVLENFKKESNISIALFRKNCNMLEKQTIKFSLLILITLLGLSIAIIPIPILSILGTLICIINAGIILENFESKRKIKQKEEKSKIFESNMEIDEIKSNINKNNFTKKQIVVNEITLDDYLALEEIYQKRKEEIKKYYNNNKLNRIFGKELSDLQLEILKLIIEDDFKKENTDSFQMVLK